MKNMIERYVYDVTRRLPENQRSEVTKELIANIEDMLSDDHSEDNIKRTLIELGDPRILASNYRHKPRYLVSPEWMDDYLQTLKIVVVIFASISLVFGLLEHIMNPEATNIVGIVFEVFFTVISEVIQSALGAFAIVTIIFAGISAYHLNHKSSQWNPDKLPDLPKENVKKISRVESIIGLTLSIIFGSLFIYFAWKNQTYIGWFDGDDFERVTVAFFNSSVIDTFIPFFIINVVLAVIVNFMKLKSGHWTIGIAIAHTIEQIVSVIILFLFATSTNVVNPAYWVEASASTTITVEQFSEGYSKGIMGLAWFIAVVSAIDILSIWIKTLKPKTKR